MPGTTPDRDIGNVRRVLEAHAHCYPFAIWRNCRVIDVSSVHNFARVIFAIGYPQAVIDSEVDFAFEEILDNTYLVAIRVGCNCVALLRIVADTKASLQD